MYTKLNGNNHESKPGAHVQDNYAVALKYFEVMLNVCQTFFKGNVFLSETRKRSSRENNWKKTNFTRF